MKKILPILLLAVGLLSFVSCATTRTYVAGAEEYPIIPIKTKTFSQNVYWDDYTLQMEKPKNGVKQVTVLGVGYKKGTVVQNGVLYKNGKELYSVSLETTVDDFALSSQNLDVTYGENTSVIKVSDSKNTYNFFVASTSRDNLINTEEPLSVNIDRICEFLDKNGNKQTMLLNQSIGSSVVVNDEQYAVIEILSKVQGIRINPEFSENLSEEDEDFLAALMLASWKFERDFKDTAVSNSTKIALF